MRICITKNPYIKFDKKKSIIDLTKKIKNMKLVGLIPMKNLFEN